MELSRSESLAESGSDAEESEDPEPAEPLCRICVCLLWPGFKGGINVMAEWLCLPVRMNFEFFFF